MTLRLQQTVLVVFAAASLGGFALSAQTPPSPTPDPVVGQTPPAAAPAAPARGGGGRGGQGGPRRDDPANAGIDWTKQPPVLPKTPEDELKLFILQPGYRMELVLADPIIQEPTAIAFDGNGRMFVVEDRSYMLDLDMTGQLDPISRISLHVDTNNDGVYDKHTVFVDNVVFPRFVTPFGPNTILTKESNAQEVWKYTDTNGDGVADKKEFFDTGYGRLGNIEGQEAFLTWALDNWMYSTYNAFRARWTPTGVIKEPTGSNGGEWGVTQDDDGRIWFESGAPGVPTNFQFPIVYGNFNQPDQLEPDFRIPWGAPVRIADMQGGMTVTRMPDGSLKGVTSSAGNDIFRGHRLPQDLVGDYIYGEPVGRIIRRVRATKREGLTYLSNVYPGNEFVKSLDPLFRPVDVTTAPDGTIYITDMYHGIIQVGNFTGPGTYLRAKIEQYDLDKVIHKGRIWRLVYDGAMRDNTDAIARDRLVPRMNSETPAQLVTRFNHPNGWWRDTAQQLLVLKQDKSVVPALTTMARGGLTPNSRGLTPSGRSDTALVARFHALWTLEGLSALSTAFVRQLMADPEPRMRVQAIRASETLYKAGDRSFAADYAKLATDANVDVAIQALLTMNRWKVPNAIETIKMTAATNTAKGVQAVATSMMNTAANAGRGGGGGRGGLTPDQVAVVERGAQIYNEVCFACHGTDGMGTPKPELSTTMAPPLAGSPRVNGHRDYVVKTMLSGLTGAVDGRTYTEVMIPMHSNDDEWIAAVASYVRSSFTNTGGFVTPADVARVRAGSGGRTAMWTVSDLNASLPQLLLADGWKATASHNSDAAMGGLRLTIWSSGEPQQAGMWFQVETAKPETLTEIQFRSPAMGGRGGGGGGRGAAAGGAPAPPPPSPGFPRGYQVDVSMDGATWRTVATGAATGINTNITFPPAQTKFVRLTQTATTEGAPAWTIEGLRLYAPGK